jgi:hypothetical protein
MKLWIDDVRPAPEGYVWCKNVNSSINLIKSFERTALSIYRENNFDDEVLERLWINLIDIDQDAGDYIRLLDWLEETGRNYPIRIHSANVVGVQNMRRIIERKGWKEVK